MFTAPSPKLLEWVRKFKADLTPEGTIQRLELWHSVEGEVGERLATVEMADRDDNEDPDDLSQEIWNAAEDDAATRPQGSYQRYVIQAYRSDSREPDEQKAFTTQGSCVSALLGASSEPPTPRGELAQTMRERNDLHGLVVRMVEHTAGSAAHQLQVERQENLRLTAIARDAEKLRQDLLDRTNEREIARLEAASGAQLGQALMAMLLQFAPVVLSKLLSAPPPNGASQPLGEAPPPPPPAPVQKRDQDVGELLGSVTREQLGPLMALFTNEQKAKFAQIYTSFRDSPPAPAGATPGSN